MNRTELVKIYEKASRYDDLKAEMQQLKQGLAEKMEEMDALFANAAIVKLGVVGTTRQRVNGSVNTIMEKMKDGQQFTKDSIAAELDIDERRAEYIMVKLRQLSCVQSRRDNRKLYLYYQQKNMSFKNPDHFKKVIKEEVKQEKLGKIPEGGVA